MVNNLINAVDSLLVERMTVMTDAYSWNLSEQDTRGKCVEF